jgi:IS5 family transposase
VDRGKRGTKRSTAVDALGIPVGTITAPANRHDSPLLNETLDAAALGGLPEGTSFHLDRGYDSGATRERLRERGLIAEISLPGGRACRARGHEAVGGGAHRLLAQRPQEELAWCTERRGRVADFWVAFSDVVVTRRQGLP